MGAGVQACVIQGFEYHTFHLYANEPIGSPPPPLLVVVLVLGILP